MVWVADQANDLVAACGQEPGQANRNLPVGPGYRHDHGASLLVRERWRVAALSVVGIGSGPNHPQRGGLQWQLACGSSSTAERRSSTRRSTHTWASTTTSPRA